MSSPNFDSLQLFRVEKAFVLFYLFTIYSMCFTDIGASKVQNLVTIQGEILEASRPKNAQLLLENKSI